MSKYSISDLAQMTGVKPHTLRMWERRYGLFSPQRTETNIRYYTEDDLKILKLVRQLNENGLRISRIAGMSIDEMERECTQFTSLPKILEEKLLAGLIALDVTMMEDVLDGAIRLYGFESTLLNLIVPFLDKMELLWLGENIEEGNEACFHELIKRKTLREIDAIPHNCSGPKVIMFLPQGNRQELNHLFMHYFMRQQGLCVTDMGAGISIDCAVSALKKSSFECIIVVNADPAHWQFEQFVNTLALRTSLPIIISGVASGENLHTRNDQVIVMEDVGDTIRFVNRLKENIQNHMS
ncbi:MAG: MerR family transcriptional regulator [Saprospiraceae bacterium]